MERRRPGIANADRPRLGPFATLLEQIPHDRSALDAVAYAYSELADDQRQALIRAVLQDASDPAQALGAVLAVEPNHALARQLTRLIHRLRGPERLATVEAGPDSGEVCLIQTQHGFATEMMRITWEDNEIKQLGIESRLGVKSGPRAAEVPVVHAIDMVAPLVWRHIQSGGVLPDGSERFAGFFSRR